MKKLLISLFVFATSLAATWPAFSQPILDHYPYADVKVPMRELQADMLDFFQSTLKENYTGANDVECAKQFFRDFNEKWHDKKGFQIQVDAEKLKAINKRLFKMDYAHYYYFYVGRVFSEKKFIKSLKKGIPVSYAREIGPEKWVSGRDVDLGSPFYMDIILRDTDMMERIAFSNSISTSQLATHLLTQDDAQIKSKLDFAAVVFWAYLCDQARINFYTGKTYQQIGAPY